MLTTEKTWLTLSIQRKPIGNETFVSLFTEWLCVAHDLQSSSWCASLKCFSQAKDMHFSGKVIAAFQWVMGKPCGKEGVFTCVNLDVMLRASLFSMGNLALWRGRVDICKAWVLPWALLFNSHCTVMPPLCCCAHPTGSTAETLSPVLENALRSSWS